ncbi:helix-turn-helix transcriptional regulator [Micromonospora sp. WMMD729]|uniref:helix-turn-helix transcriptional regulator n=1 Tax=Micromonospora sp. WMMD729 TaxID=3404127 RepID=UPI003BF5F4C5
MTEQTGPGELVAAGEILKMLGVSRSRFREIQRHPAFPRPYAVLTVGSIWLKADVERYIAEHRRPRLADGDEEA